MRAIARMTDKQLRRLMKRTSDEELRNAAEDELAERQQWREQQDDTPCIEWNGWNKPGDY